MEDDKLKLEKIVSLCKRKGFIYQGSEIYGGLAGTFDYGHYGLILKRNIENLWWDMFVNSREDMYGLQASEISSQKVWEASGHLSGFNDPSVIDVVTKKSYRADHILEDAGINPIGMTPSEMSDAIKTNNIKSVDGNAFSEVESFNLMFPLQMGASRLSSDTAYLRGELAQGMFTNYKNTLDSMHPKLPFGIAQSGKAFRNEIVAKQYIFRTREFNLMEFEYFFDPEASKWEDVFNYFREEMYKWIDVVGIDKSKLHEIEKEGADLAHYSKRTIDIEFEYPFGQKELYGLAYRTDYDLKNHEAKSGISMAYLDDATGKKFIPHVMEPTFGIDRTLLAVLASAYHEEDVSEAKDGSDVRVVLKFKNSIAPVKVCISPLLKNKEVLTSKARDLYKDIKSTFIKYNMGQVVYDDNGNVGKRYRRQDEIGTPYCVVVDFDTVGGDGSDPAKLGTVTVRDRDSMTQERVSIAELEQYFVKRLI